MYFDQGRRKGQEVTFIYYVRYFKGCLMYFPKWIEKSVLLFNIKVIAGKTMILPKAAVKSKHIYSLLYGY